MKITESPSHYEHLERMSTAELLRNMNTEDRSVPAAVSEVLPAMEALGGCHRRTHAARAAACSTWVPAPVAAWASWTPANARRPSACRTGLVIGLIAGGDAAIRKAVEFAEDDREQGWKDLQEHAIGKDDTVIGIAASGGTPYVIGALEQCNARGHPHRWHHLQPGQRGWRTRPITPSWWW
jgi:N-acetylmuramic acid 6-phosphate etherase